MKVFISLPMGGKTEEEIKAKLKEIASKLKYMYLCEIEILDSYFNFPGKNSLYYLGKCIETLSEADLAVFARDWKNYRGCRIEHSCCQEYNIPILYEN